MKNNYDFNYLVGVARQIYKEAEENALEHPTTPTIQVVIVEPFKKPYKETIQNDLTKFNEIVGGYIENVFIDITDTGKQIGLIVNEEGKLMNLPFNKRLIANDKHFDILVGTIVITAYNGQGENVSLTDQEAAKYMRVFSPTEVYV